VLALEVYASEDQRELSERREVARSAFGIVDGPELCMQELVRRRERQVIWPQRWGRLPGRRDGLRQALRGGGPLRDGLLAERLFARLERRPWQSEGARRRLVAESPERLREGTLDDARALDLVRFALSSNLALVRSGLGLGGDT